MGVVNNQPLGRDEMAYAFNTTLYQNGARFATFANLHAALLALESYFQLPRQSAWNFENATYKIKHRGIVVFNSENKEDMESLLKTGYSQTYTIPDMSFLEERVCKKYKKAQQKRQDQFNKHANIA